jgi:hypothetical protein
LSVSAPAGAGEVSETVFTVQASNDRCGGSYAVSFEEGVWDPNAQTFTWSLPAPVEICDECTGAPIAVLINADLFVRATQLYEIDLNAAVVSGDGDTRFVMGSPLLSFATVAADSAVGRASAAVTVTDLGEDGACLMGLGTPGTGVFRSYYNGYGMQGTLFTHLVGLVSVSNGGTACGSEFDPLFGFRSVGEDVDDLSTLIAFMLTANDYAAVQSTSSLPERGVCVGDFNDDGVIDNDDLFVFLAAYGTTSGDPDYNEAADFDGDGCVDMDDFRLFLGVYGESCW